MLESRNDEGIKWGLKIRKYTPGYNHPQLINHPSKDSMSLELYLMECPASQPTVTAKYSVTITDEIKEGKLLYDKNSTPVPFSVYKGTVVKRTIVRSPDGFL